jgi:phosphonate transport system substrate-binding protein
MYDLMCAKPRQSVGLVGTALYSLASVDCGVDASFKAIRFGYDSFWTQFLVHEDSEATDIADLDGLKWAYQDTGTTSGYLVPLGMMALEGVAAGDVFEAGSHVAAADAVSAGVADFATTFVSPALPDNVEVLVESPPIPNDAVAFGSQFPPGLRAQVEAALIGLADESGPQYEDVWEASVGDLYQWQGIAPAVNADWDWLRTVLEAAGIGIDDL